MDPADQDVSVLIQSGDYIYERYIVCLRPCRQILHHIRVPQELEFAWYDLSTVFQLGPDSIHFVVIADALQTSSIYRLRILLLVGDYE